MTGIEKVIEKINAKPSGRTSAWHRGVTAYANELAESLKERIEFEGREPESRAELCEWLLNGADSWSAYSWGGCSLVYDGDIAERLCTPSEFKKKRGGELRPNSREEWLDVQARALTQAAGRVKRIWRYEVFEANELA